MGVKFNDIELLDYINILQGFTPLIGAEWEPTVQSGGETKRGSDFSFTTYKAREIPMPFTITGDIGKKYDDLQKVLNVSEPKPLIFEDASDRIFYAIPSGDLEFEETGCLGTGTITWLVPDGVAHATTERSFPAAVNSSGILEAAIINAGTESVPVDYTITHNAENGYIGIVSDQGIIELGSVAELDGETVQKSETLLNYRSASDYDAMTAGGIFFAEYGTAGTFKETIYEDVSWLDVNSAGTGTGWHGAAKTISLPADSNGEVGAQNFALQSKIWFRPENVNQLGIIEYAIADEDGAHLMSVRIAKWDTARETAAIIFCVGGKEIKRVEFESMHSELLVHSTGNFHMVKSGNKFEFNFAGLHQFDFPELEEKKAKTVSIFIGQRGNYAMVEKMRIQYLTFRKDNVTEWKDIPNRYQPGDAIYIDGKTTKVYVNGIQSAGDVVKGSNFFRAPPGETKVQFYCSDFCENKPEITAKIREAYL